LHSRWTPNVVARIHGPKIVIFHDTQEVQPDRLPWDLLDVCDAMIVHEPCDLLDDPQARAPRLTDNDLYNQRKVHYWRQGVPQPHGLEGRRNRYQPGRPIVGTCGFAFPWKGFELLCDAARLAGWGVSIYSHNATNEQIVDWAARNPWLYVSTEYDDTPMMIANLQTCDATAFLYQCSNSGTSGAIRLGIAAGKPLLATRGCRQFIDLWTDETQVPRWITPDVRSVAEELCGLDPVRFDSKVVALRERDSWEHLGQKYAALYSQLVAR